MRVSPSGSMTGQMANATFSFVCLILAVSIAGCRPPLEDSSATIHVLVAASAAPAMEAIASEYVEQLSDDAKRPNIVVVSGPSSGLAQQILSGAPADIFLSASPRWMEAVGERGVEKKLLLKNRLALATHRSNVKEIESVADLSQPRVGSVAVAGESVPIGDYANQVIDQLPAEDLLKLKSKLVFAKDAAALVVWLESNEVDAGLVYLSDAERSSDLHLVATVDESQHDPIVYTVAKIVNQGNGNESHCDEFLLWLQSEKAKAIFQESGFSLP